MSTSSNSRWSKLRRKKYREQFVSAQVKQSIPLQIRALLAQQGISQEVLAGRAGLTQGVISRAANPEYGKLTLSTLVRIAAGFDVAFIGRFVPFTELDCWFTGFSEQSLRVKTFTEEDEQISGRHLSTAAEPEHDVVRALIGLGVHSLTDIGEYKKFVSQEAKLGVSANLDVSGNKTASGAGALSSVTRIPPQSADSPFPLSGAMASIWKS